MGVVSSIGNAISSVAKVALPAAAAYFTGGATLGLGAAASGALAGAAAGATNAIVNGGSVLQQGLAGGALGGVAGAVSSGLSGMLNSTGGGATAQTLADQLAQMQPGLSAADAMAQAGSMLASSPGMTADQMVAQLNASSLGGAGFSLPPGGMTATGSTPVGGGIGAGGGGTTTPSTTTGGQDWSTWAQGLLTPKNLLSIGGGLMQMAQGNALQNQAQTAAAASNPWGTSGGFALAGTQLQNLMNNPMQVAATDPAYAMRIQGAQRATAAYGQNSGAMSVGAANASTDWLNQRMQSLGNMAGVSFNPVTAAQLGLQGSLQGQQMMQQGVGTMMQPAISYGQTPGQGGGNNQALQAALLKIGNMLPGVQ